MKTALCDLLGIEHPIIAAMARPPPARDLILQMWEKAQAF
jgi:hypothetical protein